MIRKLIAHWNIGQFTSTNMRIFSGMLVIVIMNLIAKFMMGIKELVIADYFGTGEMVDAFLFAFLLPSFVINVLAGSFNAAIMPTYIRTRDNKGEEAARQLFSSILVISVLFLLLSTAALAAFAPILLSLLGSGFSEQTMVLAQTLFYWLLPVFVLTGTGRLFATIMNAGERFALVALVPIITPICSVIALVVLAKDWGVKALVAGTVLGGCLELLVLMTAAAHKNIPVLPIWEGMTEELRTVIGQYAPMIAGAFLMGSTVVIDQSMAAMLEPGSVATLSYAYKVVAAILSIGSMALGTAVLPHFSRLVGNEDWVSLRHTFRTYARLIMFTTVPITALLFLFSEPIIELLFEHGSFTAQDTELVSQVQAFYFLQLPFFLFGVLVVRLISALNSNYILMLGAAISLPLNIVLNYIFIQWMGVAGIALSTSCVYFVSCVFLILMLFWKVDLRGKSARK